jgi:hypothetical protein
MSQFLSKEQAKEYERNRLRAIEREIEELEKARPVMSPEDYENYSKLILEPFPTKAQMELEIKYGFVKRENCLY